MRCLSILERAIALNGLFFYAKEGGVSFVFIGQ